ncbi:hypothetical protein JB92DRAFT_38213 [Gautieria morchelliformis]|nr:hypothetical protein JB92DRAFT_38213 [Gautieria morchelliformis]
MSLRWTWEVCILPACRSAGPDINQATLACPNEDCEWIGPDIEVMFKVQGMMSGHKDVMYQTCCVGAIEVNVESEAWRTTCGCVSEMVLD